PHFLFNALNSIKALTREDPANSRRAIDRLAGLLRYSLRQSERALVPLSEEVSMVKEYVALEQIRLEERLVVNWEMPPDTETCLLPPLSLHTLVENGIKHGINQVPAGGKITVDLQKTPSYWQFVVINTGAYQPSSIAGTGLKNLRQRLSLQYNEVGLLHLANTFWDDQPATKAILKIPRS
ncbi:MAG: histidine kinase, partial [Bacteroidota bacterium]